jgi:hypothetical protein
MMLFISSRFKNCLTHLIFIKIDTSYSKRELVISKDAPNPTRETKKLL